FHSQHMDAGMTFGVPWQVRGVRRRARDTAREAARRSGLSVGEWLDSVILDQARHEGVDPDDISYRRHEDSPDLFDAGWDEDPRASVPPRYTENQVTDVVGRLPAVDRAFAQFRDRLDDVTRRLGELAQFKATANALRPEPPAEPPHELIAIISKL